MAKEKNPLEPEVNPFPASATPETPGSPPIPDLTDEEKVILEKEGQAALFEMGESIPDPGDVVVPFDKISELMKERNAAAREAVEQEEPPAPGAGISTEEYSGAIPGDAPAGPDTRQEWEKPQAEAEAEEKKPRRGRPPKADKAEKTD